MNTLRKAGRRQTPYQLALQAIRNAFKNLKAHEIDRLLKELGSPVPTSRAGANLDGATKKQLDDWVNSTEGKARIAEQRKSLLERDAQSYISSVEGKREFEKIKQQLLANAMPSDDELFAAACRRAVQQRVDEWLASERGNATYNRMLAESLVNRINQAPRHSQTTWVQERLKEMERGSHGT